jgi:hypothetical protein
LTESEKDQKELDTRIQRYKPFVTVQWILAVSIYLLSCDVFISCFVFQVLFKDATCYFVFLSCFVFQVLFQGIHVLCFVHFVFFGCRVCWRDSVTMIF